MQASRFLSFDLLRGLGTFDPGNYDADVCVGSLAQGTIGSVETVSTVVVHESHQYNRSASQCSASPQLDCAFQCFFANVSADRGCWPLADLSLAQKPATMQPCAQHYNFSLAEKQSANSSYQSLMLVNCATEACYPACVSRLWSYYAQSVVIPPENVLQLNIHQNAFVYIVYENSPLMDMTSLLSAFGGIIGGCDGQRLEHV